MWLIGWDFRIARVSRCTYRELWICILLYYIDGMSSTFMYKGEYDENLWIYAAESWIAQHQPIILKLFSLSLSVFFFVFFSFAIQDWMDANFLSPSISLWTTLTFLCAIDFLCQCFAHIPVFSCFFSLCESICVCMRECSVSYFSIDVHT